MIIAGDARNGGVSVGVFDGASWVARCRLASAERSADEWTYTISGLLGARGVDLQALRHGVLSSVVPSFTPVLAEAFRRLLPAGVQPILVGPGVKTGLRIRTDNPAEVGSDLVCNAVGASALVRPPTIVVDFGTALSFTALDAKGDLVGVVLAPGLDAAAAELRSRTVTLPLVRLEKPPRTIGRNTADSIRSGILVGWAGLVDRLIQEIALELQAPGESVSLVGTGPYESSPLELSRTFDVWDASLALAGLVRIAQRSIELT